MVRLTTLIAFAGISLTTATESEIDSEGGQTWGGRLEAGTPFHNVARAPREDMFEGALPQLDIKELSKDIRLVMRDNIAAWPADFGEPNGEGGNSGPQLVRLAWHCSGTYRRSDGKGGCGGARQRFEPERSWDDNTNLDKTRALLAPIKDKYGDALSWGDLINFAATESIREMGGPPTKFCFGRIDEPDGTNSEALLENGAPCNSFQGNCQEPFGTGTTGLIYVNPEGPVVEAGGSPVPDPALSAKDIRDVFRRMGDDDKDIVALIGGGHAFGKVHGACTDAPGLHPSEAFEQNLDHASIWQGTCGDGELKGVGPNTVTSGFEGPWTYTPTQWGNGFFTGLLHYEWERHTGPGGHQQWRVKNATGATAGLMRLTSDLALIYDRKFLKWVEKFARKQRVLDKAFDEAWFKLTHRGGRWSTSSFCDQGPMPQWVMDQNHKFMLDSDAISV
jgi:catalase (peroxidase I)